MTWFRRHSKDEDRERRLTEAEADVARIRERADKVGSALEARLRRNHWAEAVIQIARKES